MWQPRGRILAGSLPRTGDENGDRYQQIEGHSEVADHSHCWKKQPQDQRPDVAGKPRRQTPGQDPDVFVSNIGPGVAFANDIAPEHKEHYGDEQQVRPVQGGGDPLGSRIS